MRYSSSSAARSPCCARSTSRRTFSVDSRAGLRSVASELTRTLSSRLAGGEPDAARPAEAAEVGDIRHHHVEAAVLGLEDDHARPVLVERALERVGRRRVDEAADHLPAVEADLDAHPLAASHQTPPP